jgi:hypothetical protein
MSIIETLTEGVVNRNLQQEGAALLNKWTQTGLLEGLNESQKQNMAVLLENQAKSLLKEANSMTSQSVEGFAAVAFPIVRRVFAGLIANDLVSVQPMSLPSGLIFFLDFTFGSEVGGSDSSADFRFGNETTQNGASIYGTDKVGSQITGGVNLVGSSLKETLSGPREAVGYAFASPTGSSDVSNGNITVDLIELTSADITEADKKAMRYDADLLAEVDASTQLNVLRLTLNSTAVAALVTANADFDNLAAFDVQGTDLEAATNGATGLTATNIKMIRRLTQKKADGTMDFFFSVLNSTLSSAPSLNAALAVEIPVKDSLAAKTGGLGALDTYNYALEGNEDIPEIDIKVDSIAITAQTKKLKAKWTPELGQDLNAYHNIDAEVELTSILSEQIALEIDREILADLVNGATAATYYWSRSPGLFVDRVNGTEIGASAAAPDFTGTVSEWYETLIETINDVSAQIHRKTLRGGATHIVCSPEVANILEFTAGFRANVTADADKGDIGAVKVGSLNRKFDVIVDPYFPRNVILVARIGSSFLESGYVYAPYVPLQTTPTIFGPEDFVPRKGVMTRYAKKMVRPDMYGLVIVRDLLGGEYSS